mmetsp:Transcript_1920/g.5798  ORF Transcript_1920/g.5798 Transcript_1920/m.5798 type:complete len:89 (-) Transcript_1920:27-293(-)
MRFAAVCRLLLLLCAYALASGLSSPPPPREETTRRRLKSVLLAQEGRRMLERRVKMRALVTKDLERVRREGGVPGTPGIMMGPPDIGI